ncbi:MAG: hypothetical protein DMF53_15940 [Acidobacteria bacterium]|nr:MAG: hypothetical protein DMF53_15940 [Acidobacteriota bacterium]
MYRLLSILPLAVLMAMPATAQMDDDLSRGPSVSVDALVAEALAKSPDLAAARSRQTAAREMERPAAALADPTVGPLLQIADFPNYTIGTEDMSMAGVQVSQPLPYPGKRRARADASPARSAPSTPASTPSTRSRRPWRPGASSPTCSPPRPRRATPPAAASRRICSRPSSR